jgi:hypothetical protein
LGFRRPVFALSRRTWTPRACGNKHPACRSSLASRSFDSGAPICSSSDHWPGQDLARLTQGRTSHSILRIQGGVLLRFPESPNEQPTKPARRRGASTPAAPLPATLADLNRIIHEPARLAILTVLSSCVTADCTFLQTATGLTKGNLSLQLTRLEEAGLVASEKTIQRKRTLPAPIPASVAHSVVK